MRATAPYPPSPSVSGHCSTRARWRSVCLASVNVIPTSLLADRTCSGAYGAVPSTASPPSRSGDSRRFRQPQREARVPFTSSPQRDHFSSIDHRNGAQMTKSPRRR
ncbi:hypothetical protein JCGZ_13109 [Jatropha curcas]|uniref:Uncharacterized protein n=1 Tax=Jatropha curcas TaxID=180498 RepID=A0A067KL68_JATCU|nr:hypothetical protein JCGZ_13109 [Jatropha curcas]